MPKPAAFVKLLRKLDRERKMSRAGIQEIYGPTSPSTWKRLKKRLRDEGCELQWQRDQKVFTVPPQWSLTASHLDPRMRDRLAILRANAAALGSPFIDQLAPLLDRLDARLAAIDPEAQAKLPPRRPQPRADKEFFRKLGVVEAALRDNRMLSFRYRKGGSPGRARTIEPYAIHDHLGRFYIWGRESSRGRVKFFALDLMHDVQLDDSFQPDPALSIERALEHSFGMFIGDGPVQRMVVEVAPAAADYVRARRWPAEIESLREARAGALRLTFEVNDPREIISWVLSFGGDARIVEPAAIAEIVRRKALAVEQSHAWAERVPVDENFLQLDWSEEM